MSGFSSLLDQFKQTTQAAAVASSSASIYSSRDGGVDTKKRPRSIFEANNNNSNNHSSQARSRNNPQNQYHFPSTPVRTIYIACPAFAETGGPEALHQLCHVINTGEYSYDDNPVGDDKDGDAPKKYDEFGRVIANASKKSDGKGDKNVVRAYMLYLRERGPGSGHDGANVEHIQSSRARSSKYDRYNAPPAEMLPGTIELDYGGHHKSESSTNEYSSELIIWPECWTHLIDSRIREDVQPSSDDARRSKKYQIAIWWLSVNNNKGRFLPNQFAIRKDVLHLVQSAYARDYVSSKLVVVSRGNARSKAGKGEDKDDKDGGLNVMNLTEFIPYASSTFSPKITTEGATQQQEDADESALKGSQKESASRDLDVVYNPAKGMHYTDEIIRRACGKKFKTNDDGSVIGGGIKFQPIGKGAGGRERMTGEEVVALLKRSKVYIDFGPHPGMDRLPREAALAGCIVLTNREGAANFDQDVPLPSEFKFRSFGIDSIYTLLKDCCNNNEKYSEYVEKMKSYKDFILGQEKQMEVCVDRFVDNLVTRRIDL